MAIAGLVLGICSLALFWVPYFNTVLLVLGIVGIILSAKGGKQLKAMGRPAGVATAGLVLSIIGTVFAAIGFVSCTICPLCVICGATAAF